MKKTYVAGLVLGMLTGGTSLFSQINYTMTPGNSTYTSLSGGTSIPDLSAGSDLTLTTGLPIGFDFVFDDSTYTEFQMSDNGYIHLGNELFPTGYGSAGGDAVVPNDFKDSTCMTPGENTTRPFIAALWEDLAMANLGGNSSYLTSGIMPNRTLTVEWDKVSWRFSTGTDQISFQIVLHETSNVIDFIYKQGPIALGSLPTASIGLAGRAYGDFYSLSDSGPNPTVSKTINTVDISTKPADGQMYTWIPAPAIGIAGNKITLPVSIYFESEKNSLNVSGNFEQSGKYSIIISDILGKEIAKSNMEVTSVGKNNFNIQLPVCSSGVYIACVSGGVMRVQSKFIKE